MRRITEAQQYSRGKPVVLHGTLTEGGVYAIVRNGSMQGRHCITENRDGSAVMTKVRAGNTLRQKVRRALMITTTRNISPHKSNLALVFISVPDHLNCR